MRLDVVLLERGLAPSRSKAKEMILNGAVTYNGVVVTRPAIEVAEEDELAVLPNDLQRYVGRGGLKLEGALDRFGVSPQDLVCADIGASSGGFTDCLLSRGARLVYAIDSGRDQLHPSLRENKAVVVMEETNARYLKKEMFDPPVSFVVMDVSFISQTLLHQCVADILSEGGVFISLIKPQFEVGRSGLNKQGIVRNERLRNEAVRTVTQSAESFGFVLEGVIPSPITGGDGTEEFLAYFLKPD